MNKFEKLNNATLITTNSTRKYLVSLISKLKFKDLKIFTDKECLKNINYQIDKEAITKIMELHKEISFYEAKKIYEALPYLTSDPNEKTHKLINYLNELKECGYVHKNQYFSDLLKSKPLFVDSIVLTPSLEYYLKTNSINYEIFEGENVKLEEKEYVEFNNAADELFYVLNEISKLVSDGFDINKIYIYGLSDAYRYPLSYLGDLFNLPIDYKFPKALINDDLGKEIMQSLRFNDCVSSYNELKEKYEKYDNHVLILKNLHKIYSELIKYENANLDNDVQMDVFRNVIKEQTLVNLSMKNAVKCVNDFIYDENSKVFVMNFASDSYPRIATNNSYFDNQTLLDLHAETCEEKNYKTKKELINFLSQDNIALISRKKHGGDGNNYLPSLIKEFNMVKKETKFQEVQFAKDYLPFILSSYKDKYAKYRFRDPNYPTLLSTVDDRYKSYNNAFNGARVYFDEYFHLSASSADNYSSCPFKYYIEKQLFSKSDEEDSFNIKLGNLVHKLLENSYSETFDFDTEFDVEVEKLNFSEYEKIFLNRTRYDTKNLIDYIREHERRFPKNFTEETEFPIDFVTEGGTRILGRIDKFYKFHCDGQEYYTVVDYKSSDHKFDERQLDYGKSLQLPTYMLALDRMDSFSGGKILGIFYQTILANQTNYLLPTDKIDDTKYFNNYRLSGVMLDEEDGLAMLDSDFSGNYVKSLVKTGPGKPYKNSRNSYLFYTEEQFNKIIEKVSKKYDEIAKNIKDGKFDISPVQMGSDSSPCQFCNYKDICYAKSTDVKKIKLDKNEEDDD